MGLFNRNRKPIAPYNTLELEKRAALYFLLEYLTMNGVPFHEQSWAFQYLEKATKYFGLSNKQIQELRPFYGTYEKIIEYIKIIDDRQIIEYMISNCSNLFILMDGGAKHKELGEQAYRLYEELGFSYEEVRSIVRKYQYRTEI